MNNSKIKIFDEQSASPKGKRPQSANLFNPFSRKTPPSLDALKKRTGRESHEGLLDLLIEELIALKEIKNNIAYQESGRDKMSSTRAQNMVRNPSDDVLRKKSVARYFHHFF